MPTRTGGNAVSKGCRREGRRVADGSKSPPALEPRAAIGLVGPEAGLPQQVAWQDRAHFFGAVSMAMRSVLVDHARARQTDKRGGDWQRVGYTVSEVGEDSNIADLLTLDALLRQLAQVDPRAA